MADGGRTVARPFRSFEGNDAGMIPALRALRLPRFIMKIYAWYLRYFRQDSIYAGLVENFREKTVAEYYALIAQREDYRARWFKIWRGAQVEGSSGNDGVDFILTVPNALPAVPHRGMRHGWKACGYTFIFNLVRDELITRCETLNLADVKLDYSSGVMPITRVNKDSDMLPSSFHPRNAIERNNYRMYDASAMEGLPVGVQVVGKRLDEERVLEAMKLIQSLMKDARSSYEGLPLY